jgi:YgiT-type zinc finger domain-containing protein
MNMKCPACGAAELVHDTRDMPYTYRGESTIIPDVNGDCLAAQIAWQQTIVWRLRAARGTRDFTRVG